MSQQNGKQQQQGEKKVTFKQNGNGGNGNGNGNGKQQNGNTPRQNNNNNKRNNNNNNNGNNNGNKKGNNNNNGKQHHEQRQTDPVNKAVSDIREVLPEVDKFDIRNALEVNNFNKEKAVESLIEQKPTSWSDVVKKKIHTRTEEVTFVTPSTTTTTTTTTTTQQTNNKQQQQVQQQQQNQQIQQQQQQQQLQYHHFQQFSAFDQQSPDTYLQIQQQQTTQIQPEHIVGDISRVIDDHLRDIESRTQWLVALKKELDEINSTGRDQLKNYQHEMVELRNQESHLLQELNRVKQRLTFLEDEISRQEKDKLLKLKNFEMKNLSNGYLALPHY